MIEVREQRLNDELQSYGSVIVAFSGGADSAYLAWAATRQLHDRVLCITADSPSYPEHHRQLALRIAREFNLRNEIIRTGELERPEYRANPVDRCYYCKHELYSTLTTIARERGIAVIANRPFGSGSLFFSHANDAGFWLVKNTSAFHLARR